MENLESQYLVEKSKMETNISELKEYKGAVKALSKLKSDLVFQNSSHDHAAIVLSEMMSASQKIFRIYDDNLSGDVADNSPEFLASLREHVTSGKIFKIVVDSIENCSDSKVCMLINELKSENPERVEIALSNDEFKNSIRGVFNKKINFAVGDESSFRIEEMDDEGIVGSRKAICSFNKPTVSRKLINAFDLSFAKCESV